MTETIAVQDAYSLEEVERILERTRLLTGLSEKAVRKLWAEDYEGDDPKDEPALSQFDALSKKVSMSEPERTRELAAGCKGLGA